MEKKEILEEHEKGLDLAFKKFRREVTELDNKKTLALSIGRFLPKDWSISYAGAYSFVISKKKSAKATEFQEIVRQVERITGLQANRTARDYFGEVRLCAEIFYKNFPVLVIQHKPQCQISYETREVPAHTEKKVVVPKTCLGG